MNTLRVNFLTKFKNIATVRYEKINENITAIMARKLSSVLPTL